MSIYIMVISFGNNCARNTCIDNTCAIDTQIRCVGIRNACTKCIYTKEIFARIVEPRALARLGVILIGLEVNNYYLLLFIELVFASTKGMSC